MFIMGKSSKTFWDVCSPVYDFAQKRNTNYDKWNNKVRDWVPKDSTVLEIAGGTGEISIRIADKADMIICTDLSEKMLQVAKRKAKKKDIKNISFKILDAYDTGYEEDTFDVVIASQVIHLLDDPKRAADEMLRVAKDRVILPICLEQEAKGFGKIQIGVWKLLGFKPKYTFDQYSYAIFLRRLGFKITRAVIIKGRMPIMVVECEKR